MIPPFIAQILGVLVRAGVVAAASYLAGHAGITLSESQIGSIDAGKLANLVVVTGDPLEIRSQIRHVIVAGRDVPLDNSQVELFKKYMAR
jgi:imidazolonepropionase-like amidohydrolase